MPCGSTSRTETTFSATSKACASFPLSMATSRRNRTLRGLCAPFPASRAPWPLTMRYSKKNTASHWRLPPQRSRLRTMNVWRKPQARLPRSRSCRSEKRNSSAMEKPRTFVLLHLTWSRPAVRHAGFFPCLALARGRKQDQMCENRAWRTSFFRQNRKQLTTLTTFAYIDEKY